MHVKKRRRVIVDIWIQPLPANYNDEIMPQMSLRLAHFYIVLSFKRRCWIKMLPLTSISIVTV